MLRILVAFAFCGSCAALSVRSSICHQIGRTITLWSRGRPLYAENKDGRGPMMGAPVPFDGLFARDDIVVKPKKEDQLPIMKPVQNKDPRDEPPASKKSQFVEDPSRPTGYINEDEEEDNWVPSNDSAGFEKFMKDYILPSEYDSSKRADAKFTVRSVILFSFAIGAIFTTLFYAFPGKFIERRGDVNFSSRYEQKFEDTNKLLEKDLKGNEGEYFDDMGAPPPIEQTRFPYETKTEPRAPGRSVNL